jgi:hypothetical protein
MVYGLNDNIDILGRVFHVQTEITSGPDPIVRSAVFLDGAIVASREIPVAELDAPDDSIRDQMETQHAQVIKNLVNRDSELSEWQANLGLEELPPPTSPAPSAPPSNHVAPPDLDDDPRLRSSVAVRRLIGPFSLTFNPSPFHDPQAVRARLGNASDMIDEIMTAPAFSDIRLDEQVRFFDLRQRLAEWRGSGRDPDVGAEILLAVVVFAGHLRRINDRRELVTFDHKLLTWVLSELGRSGAGDGVLSWLQSLYGRDADLDRLLDQPDEIEEERLLELLLRLLDRTHPLVPA